MLLESGLERGPGLLTKLLQPFPAGYRGHFGEAEHLDYLRTHVLLFPNSNIFLLFQRCALYPQTIVIPPAMLEVARMQSLPGRQYFLRVVTFITELIQRSSSIACGPASQ
ncbi:uncharacterized protein [Drosophila suzukii]|uniref:Uncharacterized protein n=1 Tax=Drosophila suzukii TaxID=28584 RepID=A0ABM4TZF8_DROSZ